MYQILQAQADKRQVTWEPSSLHGSSSESPKSGYLLKVLLNAFTSRWWITCFILNCSISPKQTAFVLKKSSNYGADKTHLAAFCPQARSRRLKIPASGTESCQMSNPGASGPSRAFSHPFTNQRVENLRFSGLSNRTCFCLTLTEV